MKKGKYYIDPPSGWRFGFPKSIPQKVIKEKKILQWLVEKGYPKKLIDELGDNFIYRMWRK